jgi:hypothetical protein
MGEKKSNPHTTWVDDDLNQFIAVDALERCQSVSDYLRSLVQKRMEEKLRKSISPIDGDELAGILMSVAKRLRGDA